MIHREGDIKYADTHTQAKNRRENRKAESQTSHKTLCLNCLISLA